MLGRSARLVSVAVALVVLRPTPCEACGCFSPPEPPAGVSAQDYAIAQRSEQIIFEVNGDGTITAHVLIEYEGDPASFAWIVPVPNAPALALSEDFAFRLLDSMTRPADPQEPADICPRPVYQCRQHPRLYCPGARSCFPPGLDAAASDSAVDGSVGPPDDPPVDVIDRAVIGMYDTVTFAAGDAAAAILWLQSEGFIVNATMAPFMQPYADAGMVFVASRLVAGADLDAIRPLRMTYRADMPMIPLRLTAIAADPHLAVTAFIFGECPFEAMGHPNITLRTEEIVFANGRSNYPSALARQIDEAGGDAFVTEWSDLAPLPPFSAEFCCGESDRCGIGGDGVCQCPLSSFEEIDCSDEIRDGARLVEDLAFRHRSLTRITTRLSPEEMTFDPMYQPAPSAGRVRVALSARAMTLDACTGAILDADRVEAERLAAVQICATTYCGDGQCVESDGRAGCVCGANRVARSFTDLDARRSITCVPDVPIVDYAAGGITLPDACAGVDCGDGTCLDLGGFATCDCDPDRAAVLFDGRPRCERFGSPSGSAGGEDYSQPLRDIDVCAPPPPTSCGTNGWLVRVAQRPHVVECDSSMPSNPRLLVVPPMPMCPPPPPEPDCGVGDLDAGTMIVGGGGCVCSASHSRNRGFGGALFVTLVFLLVRPRRR